MLRKFNRLFQESPITKIFIIAPFIQCVNKLYTDCDDKPKTTHIRFERKVFIVR